MRTKQLALAAALIAAAFSANAAQNRMETASGPFTYEALGATPTLTFGRAQAPKAAPAAVTAESPKAATPAKASVPNKATAATVTPFTYDSLGATPEVKKQPVRSEVQAPASAH